ncbi:uncharacterized protein LOC144477212 isoform X6 [Augochlora pura]
MERARSAAQRPMECNTLLWPPPAATACFTPGPEVEQHLRADSSRHYDSPVSLNHDYWCGAGPTDLVVALVG